MKLVTLATVSMVIYFKILTFEFFVVKMYRSAKGRIRRVEITGNLNCPESAKLSKPRK